MVMDNVAIILAGGSGSRLWPLSTNDHPKPLLEIFGKKSMLESTLFRAKLFADVVYVVTNNDMGHAGEHVFHDLGIDRANVLIEPRGADTAAAIAFGVAHIKREYGADVVISTLPVDHQIRNHGAFYRDISFALESARKHRMMTLVGIVPSFPATGYGYIKLGSAKEHQGRNFLFDVDAFLEKPDQATAKHFLEDPDYAWNGGMYVGAISAFEQTFKTHLPLYDWYNSVVHTKTTPMPDTFRDFQFDHELIESNAPNLQAIMATFDWKDVGTYDELYRSALEADEQGNVIQAEATLRDCADCLIIGGDKKIVALGLNDMAVIDGPDGILVCQKSIYSQLVGSIATGKEQPAHK